MLRNREWQIFKEKKFYIIILAGTSDLKCFFVDVGKHDLACVLCCPTLFVVCPSNISVKFSKTP